MRLNKATHYGLYAALEMARLEADATVTVAEVASRYDLPEGVLAKVFQQLARGGIARGTRGVGGGYRLARAASAVSVLDVIDALQQSEDGILVPQRPESTVGSPSARSLHRLFSEVDNMARVTFASTSLETLARE